MSLLQALSFVLDAPEVHKVWHLAVLAMCWLTYQSWLHVTLLAQSACD